MRLVLASTSPRRKELLHQIGVVFSQLKIDINEDILADESPKDYVLRLSEEKAAAGFRQLTLQEQQESVVLSADTTVVCDGHIFTKPESLSHSKIMLGQLSGREHQVLTSIALQSKDTIHKQVVITHVTFRQIAESEIEAYWETGEPQDKAGSYGIQGLASIFVESIRGSYSNVVGLPLCETAELLKQLNIPLWQDE
jgi:septum formation protein